MSKTSDDTKRKVYEIFGRNEKMVDDDVEIIKKWLITQPHLPEIMDDTKIRNFLNLNKYSIEKTKHRIDMYYTIRSLLPEMFERTNPKLGYLKAMFDATYFTVLPNKVDGIHTVYFIKQKFPDTLDVANWGNFWYSTFEVRLNEDFMVDEIVVFDFSTMTLNDLKKVTPSWLSKVFTVYQKVYSLRLKSIIYVNAPPYMSILLQVLKAVMKKKIFDRVQFHPDSSVLKNLLPLDCIPKDYGGDAPSLEELNESFEKKINDYQERFDKLDAMKVDESLRPEKLDNDEILGFYGSFKKLDVD